MKYVGSPPKSRTVGVPSVRTMYRGRYGIMEDVALITLGGLVLAMSSKMQLLMPLPHIRFSRLPGLSLILLTVVIVDDPLTAAGALGSVMSAVEWLTLAAGLN